MNRATVILALAVVSVACATFIIGVCSWAFGWKSDPPAPVERIVYESLCLKCGSRFTSDTPSAKPMRSCPFCPLDVCDKGLGYLLTFGTIQGIANAQPENAEAQEKWAKLKAEMEEHFAECEKCREAFAESM